jgi:hypothetical protein
MKNLAKIVFIFFDLILEAGGGQGRSSKGGQADS